MITPVHKAFAHKTVIVWLFWMMLASPGRHALADQKAAEPADTPPCASASRTALGALYVDPAGEDADEGTEGRPIQTLQHALALAAGQPGRTIYLRGGVHMIQDSLVLGPEHAGLALIACAGQHPEIDRHPLTRTALLAIRHTRDVTIEGLAFGATHPNGTALLLDDAEECLITGNRSEAAGDGILLRNARRNILQRNLILNSARSGIELQDDSDGNGVDSNVIRGTGGLETHGGGIFLHGASRNLIIRNRVSDTAGMGIGVANWDDTTINLGNAVVGNAVLHTNLTATDSGAIYLLGRSQLSTATRVADNWIDGTGAPDRHSVGIYLDDSVSGVRVTGNVVRNVGSDAVQIHGGSDNMIMHNVLDLGDGRASAVLFQAAPEDTNPTNRQEGNVVQDNIILSASRWPKVFVWLDGGHPLVAGNLFFNTVGASMTGEPPVQDKRPVLANPGFVDAAAGNYSVAVEPIAGFPPLTASPERP